MGSFITMTLGEGYIGLLYHNDPEGGYIGLLYHNDPGGGVHWAPLSQ